MRQQYDCNRSFTPISTQGSKWHMNCNFQAKPSWISKWMDFVTRSWSHHDCHLPAPLQEQDVIILAISEQSSFHRSRTPAERRTIWYILLCCPGNRLLRSRVSRVSHEVGCQSMMNERVYVSLVKVSVMSWPLSITWWCCIVFWRKPRACSELLGRKNHWDHIIEKAARSGRINCRVP